MPWTSVTMPPATRPCTDILGRVTSGPLLVFRKNGTQCVARYEAYDDDSSYRWITDCSEGWDITREVTHWRMLPDGPCAQTAAPPPATETRGGFEISVNITVSGPGMVINGPLRTIVEALQAGGARVDVDNPHPAEAAPDRADRAPLRGMKVAIRAVHCPWGG